jgi:hypothetical protein
MTSGQLYGLHSTSYYKILLFWEKMKIKHTYIVWCMCNHMHAMGRGYMCNPN